MRKSRQKSGASTSPSGQKKACELDAKRALMREGRRLLMRQLPLSVEDVRVYVRRLRDHGRCTVSSSDSVVISINPDQPESLMLYALAEEWAHAFVILNYPNVTDEHGPEWGVAYSTCLRALDELFNKAKW